MPRLIVGASGAAITTKTGTAPQILLYILYPLGYATYATKEMTISGTFFEGSIVEVGEVVSEIKKESSAITSNCSITMSDLNGTLKAGLDSTIFEKQKAQLYLHYEGNGLGDIIPLIIGNIAGPVVWSESERTLTFSVESVQENQDFGFAPTVDDFPDLDPDANGIPWPAIFGKPAHVPALKIKRKATGSLIAPIRFYNNIAYASSDTDVILGEDPTLYNNLTDTEESNKIYILGLDTFPPDTTKITIDGVIFQGSIDSTNPVLFNVTHSNLPKYENVGFGNRLGSDQDNNSSYIAWMSDDTTIIAHCAIYYKWTSGPTFYNHCEMQIGRKCWFRYPFIKYTTNSSHAAGKVTLFRIDSDYTLVAAYPIQKNGMVTDIQADIQEAKSALIVRQGAVGGKNPFGSLLARLDKMRDDAQSWWHAPSDAIVRPLSDEADADVYVASLVQMASVKAVYGKKKLKTISGKTYSAFQPLPESYYTVQLVSSYMVGTTGQFATTITLATSLSEYHDQDWEDGIWVTGVSTIGPNPIDIITWIIDNFTEFTVDTTGISTFRSLVRPANFAIFDKRDALQISEEICWQARMGMILDLGVIQLRFLPKKPLLPTVTFTDDNIENKDGMSLTYTPVASVITKVIATWADTYKDKVQTTHLNQSAIRDVEEIVRAIVPQARRTTSENKYYIYRTNEDIFGNKPVNKAVYIYNTLSPVKETIDFWGFREGNCWRKVDVRGFPDCLTLQCFDTVQLAPTDVFILSGGPWIAMVESIRFKFTDMSITLGVVIPCKAGTSSPLDDDFWPGNVF